MVNNFGDATWWAFMNVTTVGSNIYAVTTVGKILSVCLAAMGMMMFPIFTVYITDRIQEINKKRRRDLFLKIINERNNKTPNIGVQENKTPENTDDVNLNK